MFNAKSYSIGDKLDTDPSSFKRVSTILGKQMTKMTLFSFLLRIIDICCIGANNYECTYIYVNI
jgi:hypothetical protein